MNKSELLRIVEDLTKLYNPDVNTHVEEDIDDIDFEGYKESYVDQLLEEYSEVEDPTEKINAIISDCIDSEQEIDEEDLEKILNILPENNKIGQLFEETFNYMDGSDFASEDAGELFKECGESLEDIPVDYLASSKFLQSYIRHTTSKDENIKESSYIDLKETRGEMIDMIKAGFDKSHLTDIKQMLKDRSKDI